MKSSNGLQTVTSTPQSVKCIAIIPARGGSKGVPRKNTRLVGGIPLVARSIIAAHASRRVDTVYVSTDDPEIAAIAKQYHAQVIMRPIDISGDEASSESALLHTLDVIHRDGINPAIVVFLQCTSPFTTPWGIDSVVAGLNDPYYAVALSVAEDHSFLWSTTKKGQGIGINHDASQPRKRRQDLPPQYRETGAVYAMRASEFKDKKNRFCGPVIPIPLDLPAMEIDTPDDLLLANAMIQSHKATVSEQVPPPHGIKVLVTDFDGVHTDDCVYVDENGKETVRCSRSDGMGIELLKKAGIEVLILSKESNPVVSARASKLGIAVIQQCQDKKTELQNWLVNCKLDARHVAYVGNDINDLECLAMVGWPCAPSDAHPQVKEKGVYSTKALGGQGAIREIAEILLSACRQNNIVPLK